MLGDILPASDMQKRFIIECKNYKSFAWDKLKKGDIPAKLKGWIGEINFDTISYLMFKEKHPEEREHLAFLFFKITRQGEWICYNKEYFKSFVCTPEFEVQYETEDRLKEAGYGNTYCVEPFKDFVVINRNKLFERRVM